jgi:hypothetical protein
MSQITHLWIAMPTSVNHSYQIVAGDKIIAQRLRKADAARIVRNVNEHAALMARACHAEARLRDAERTVERLRAYIRDNEVKTLRGIRAGIWQEGI